MRGCVSVVCEYISKLFACGYAGSVCMFVCFAPSNYTHIPDNRYTYRRAHIQKIETDTIYTTSATSCKSCTVSTPPQSLPNPSPQNPHDALFPCICMDTCRAECVIPKITRSHHAYSRPDGAVLPRRRALFLLNDGRSLLLLSG